MSSPPPPNSVLHDIMSPRKQNWCQLVHTVLRCPITLSCGFTATYVKVLKRVHWCVAIVPGEPKKVRLEAINSTAAFVEWQPPARNERNGIIRGYQVHYVPVDENETPIGEPDYHNVVDGDKTDAVVTGLEADTRYKFHVVAYTRKGDGIRSKARVVTTKGAGKLCVTQLVKYHNSRLLASSQHGFQLIAG